MPSFGSTSRANLNECHPLLIKVAEHAIQRIDFSVICGYRDKAAQTAAYNSGASRAKFGQSPHNHKPSYAFDVIPYPFKGWHYLPDFEAVGKQILLSAQELNIGVTWGKSFKGLVDYPHFELTGWRNMVKD
jgi:peptidoglycan L-alanyl-D-glutamate endopeptidase CwlK